MRNTKIKIIYLNKNCGHGIARNISLKYCEHNLVAIMDSDDLSTPQRFEKQIRAFNTAENIDIVGGQISEFTDDIDNVIGIRQVPLVDAEIKKYAKKRCPMNQVTVMFKKQPVEKVGGYLDWYCEEDYYLWVRMILSNCTFKNIDEVLVNVRVNNEMAARRGGLKYFRSEKAFQKYLLKNHIIGFFRYCFNVLIRFVGEVLLTSKMRKKAFKAFRVAKIEQQHINEQINDITLIDFSVAMCVYEKDNPIWFDSAIDSIIKQTLVPNEIVIVVDGPIPTKIKDVLQKWSQQYETANIYLSKDEIDKL